MSATGTTAARSRPIWKQAVSAVPVGVAVAAFVAVRWPWDLAVVVVLIALAILMSRLPRGGSRASVLDTLLLDASLFLALFVGLGVYANASVRQAWLPGPALAGMGVVAGLLGVMWFASVLRR